MRLRRISPTHLAKICDGDARKALSILETAVIAAKQPNESTIRIDLEAMKLAVGRRAVQYDPTGDEHYDCVSALIKSIRGSDPDAGLYWLARMLEGGEDIRFICRRLIILASEDVGLADPQAVAVVMACAQSFDRIGLPEGQYPLAQAALYLSTAPKSNSALAYFDALASVEKEREGDVTMRRRRRRRRSLEEFKCLY